MGGEEAKRVGTRDGREIGALATELGTAYGRMVAYHRETLGLSPDEAVAKTQELIDQSADDRWVLALDPDRLSWWTLAVEAEHDPGRALKTWEHLLGSAKSDLATGTRTSKALQGYNESPAERARFLAVREALFEGWKPANEVEMLLLDAMAQAYHAQLFWMERLMRRATLDAAYEDAHAEATGTWLPPRVADAEACDQAAAMVDRFSRLFARTLRALRDLRRYSPTVTIGSAGQVNIGAQQINTSAPDKR